MKELLDTLRNRIHDLAAYAAALKAENQNLAQQIESLTQKSAVAQTQAEVATEWAAGEESAEIQAASEQEAKEIVRLQTELAQQAERFRIEFSLLKQQHEQNLSNLNQAFSVQSGLLKQQLAAARQAQPAVSGDEAEFQRIQAENTRLKILLSQSAERAAVLAEQLAKERV